MFDEADLAARAACVGSCRPVRHERAPIGWGGRGVGYEWQALIAGDHLLRDASWEIPEARVMPLHQGVVADADDRSGLQHRH